MELIIVRHAIALDKAVAAKKNIPDSLRELTKKGKKQFRNFLSGKKPLFEKTDKLISSPFDRAEQTALILKEKILKKKRLEFSELLEPDRDPKEIINFLKNHKTGKVVLVTHEPFMSRLVSNLVKTPIQNLKIKKGAIVIIQEKDGHYEMSQLLNP